MKLDSMYFYFFFSLSIIVLRYMHAVVFTNISSIFVVELNSIVWPYFYMFIHSAIGEQSDCFQFVAISSKDAMTIPVEVFVWIHAFISLG